MITAVLAKTGSQSILHPCSTLNAPPCCRIPSRATWPRAIHLQHLCAARALMPPYVDAPKGSVCAASTRHHRSFLLVPVLSALVPPTGALCHPLGIASIAVRTPSIKTMLFSPYRHNPKPLVGILPFFANMMTLSVMEEISSPYLPGMVHVLRRMLFQLRLTSRYTLYRAQITPTQWKYWADVRLLDLSPDDTRLSLFHGQSMATPALAYQMAAWEAVARIRFLYVPVDCRAPAFFPMRSYPGGITRFSGDAPRQDPAIAPMLHFTAAQYDLFIDVVEELIITRKALARLLDP